MADLPRNEIRSGVHIHRIPCIRRHRGYSTLPELATQVPGSLKKAIELSRTGHYDINHTHFVVPSGVVAYLLKRVTGLDYVLTAHGSDVPGYNPDRFRLTHRLILPAWRRILSEAAATHTPSQFLRGMIRAKQPELPVDVIPYGFDEPPTISAGSRQNRLLVVTRMFERKGVQFLLQALDGLELPWEVCVAGDGPYLDTLKQLASRLSIPVRFVGFVQGEPLWELYRSSKVFVFPSIQENFPVVLLEAMAYGCAVITTSAEGCGEVVGDAAIKVVPGDVGALRDAVQRLASDREAVERLASRGPKRVKQFAWDRIAEEFERFYRKAIDAA
jgi:glycosyltransferase involved in cell wall biosynthesis